MMASISGRPNVPFSTSSAPATDDILCARALFDLLQRTIHYFVLALPEVDYSQPETTHDPCSVKLDQDHELEQLMDDVTLLRADTKRLREELRILDINESITSVDIEGLVKSLRSLLGLFEDSVVSLEIDTPFFSTQAAPWSDEFPNLSKLWALGQKKLITGAYSPTLIAASSVRFPPLHISVKDCWEQVCSAGGTIVNILGSTFNGQWDAESQLREGFTSTEINKIRDADTFSNASKSLFELLLKCDECEEQHMVRLHLSGFRAGQLEMSFNIRNSTWISANFTHSPVPRSSGEKINQRLCAHISTAEGGKQKIQGYFDKATVWEECTRESDSMPSAILSAECFAYCRMADSLKWNDTKLTRKELQVIRLHLVWSWFRLYGSSWIRYASHVENSLQISRKSTINGQEFHLLPHIFLSPPESPEYSTTAEEDIAGLGVLIIELEVNRLATWEEEDVDFETMTHSNMLRLRRILQEWKDDLHEFHRGLGDVCLRFKSLVEDFDHPSISRSSRSLAILYKCILLPLYENLMKNFSAAEAFFEGDFSVPDIRKRDDYPALMTLYDDDEKGGATEKSGYARAFFNQVENDFLSKISYLRRTQQFGITRARTRRMLDPERIRIAVLDTGVNMDDDLIRGAARKRINKKHSFVANPDECSDTHGECSDTHGHGTHVIRLLLTMAPNAELFIAKISDDRNINASEMSRIAKAIDWAVQENVHIISMSFGYWKQNDEINEAIDKALKANILLFAAASNVGGNKARGKGRAFPSRNPDVFCIHACDGRGNKGDMSPSPESRLVNWTTLGIDIESEWQDKMVYKSGTSYATPIAAGFAASVLEFANFRCDLQERHKMYRKAGMVKIFEAMSTERDGYDYILPTNLWDRGDEDVIRVIQDAFTGQ